MGACQWHLQSLGINWSPHSPQPIPEVLRDPVITKILSSDPIRLQLLSLRGPITDYKRIIDAQPLYPAGTTPQFPSSLEVNGLVDYVLRNYDIAHGSGAIHVKLPESQRVPEPPLLTALKRQGLQLPLIGQGSLAIHHFWEDNLRRTPRDTRTTLLPLPRIYVPPGGRFDESYFWDSLWIMKGLIESGYGWIARGMLENFVSLYEIYGIIPNGNRFYYLTRTQPPVLMMMVELLESHGQLKFTPENFKPGRLEYRTLMAAEGYYKKIWKGTDRFKPAFGLFGYSDGAGGAGKKGRIVIRPEASLREPRADETHSRRVFAEKGWDMVFTRDGDRPQDYLPVELNFLLSGYTNSLANYFERLGVRESETYFRQENASIGENLPRLYDPSSRLYMDYNYVTQTRSDTVSAASFFPFYFGAYPQGNKAKATLRQLLKILKPNGHLSLHTTDREGSGQWDGSWSWAPLVELAFQSLVRYGLIEEAKQLALDYCEMVLTSFHRTGVFHEKYRAKDGSITLPANTEIYGNEEGFGWTDGTVAVFLKALSQWNLLAELERRIAARLAR